MSGAEGLPRAASVDRDQLRRPRRSWRVPGAVGGITILFVATVIGIDIVHHIDAQSSSEEFVVNLHSGVAAQVTHGEADDGYPVWTSNGRLAETRHLTDGKANDDDPVFMPDSRSIVFIRTRPGTQKAAIFSVSIATDHVRRVSPWTLTDLDTYMAVSPSGRFVAMVEYPYYSSVPYLEVLNLRTHRMRRLAGDPQLTTPSWSPDSREIAFATEPYSERPGSDYGAVVTITPRGEHKHVFVGYSEATETDDLAFSPNGRSIAYTLTPVDQDD